MKNKQSFLMFTEKTGLKPLYYSFTPYRVMLAAIKAIPVGFAYQVVDDMEEFDIGKKETQKQIVDNCETLFLKDIAVSTTERVIEHIIVANVDEHTSEKMFKSIKTSSIRKDEKMDRWDATCAMFKTSIRCGFIYHVALFLFEETLLFYRWIRAMRPNSANTKAIEDERKVSKRHKKYSGLNLQMVTKQTCKNGIVCIAAIIAEALGACVGTYFYPGNGTLVCDRLFGNLAYILFSFVCEKKVISSDSQMYPYFPRHTFYLNGDL